MTKKALSLAGLLLAFSVCACVAASHPVVGLGLFSSLGLVGMAVGTVTYRDPAAVAGTTVAPTTSQVVNAVIADVTMADAVTATTVTHNLPGVSTNGANGSPFVHVFPLTSGTLGMGVTVSFTTNGVILTNITSAAGGGGQYRVQIWRHSLITNYTV